MRDLGELLRAAGHPVPDPGRRGLDRHCADPVVMVWIGLVDTDNPGAGGVTIDDFPAPLLSLAVSALGDLA